MKMARTRPSWISQATRARSAARQTPSGFARSASGVARFTRSKPAACARRGPKPPRPIASAPAAPSALPQVQDREGRGLDPDGGGIDRIALPSPGGARRGVRAGAITLRGEAPGKRASAPPGGRSGVETASQSPGAGSVAIPSRRSDHSRSIVRILLTGPLTPPQSGLERIRAGDRLCSGAQAPLVHRRESGRFRNADRLDDRHCDRHRRLLRPAEAEAQIQIDPDHQTQQRGV